jgi:hypothetical protein
MVSKWITFPELCKRWQINQYNLAEIVLSGKIRGYDENFAELCIGEDYSFLAYPDGNCSSGSQIQLTVEDLKGLAFLLDDIKVFEKSELRMNPTNPDKSYIRDSIQKITKILQQEKTPIDRKTIINRLERDYLRKRNIPLPSISTLNRIFNDLSVPSGKPGRKPIAK